MSQILSKAMLHDYAVETASGNTSAREVTIGTGLNMSVHCSAAAVPTSLDIEVEYSINGTNWFSAGTAHTFTQITAAGAFEAKQWTAEARFYRVKWTIVGTSFTFAIHCFEI
jgi:hypothetical protein